MRAWNWLWNFMKGKWPVIERKVLKMALDYAIGKMDGLRPLITAKIIEIQHNVQQLGPNEISSQIVDVMENYLTEEVKKYTEVPKQ